MFSVNQLQTSDPFPDILGQSSAKQQLSSAMLMGRNVVIVGPPGIGKTTLAKNVAKLLQPLLLNKCPYHCTPQAPICPSCLASPPGARPVSLVSGEKRFVRIQGSPDLTVEDLLGDIDPIKAFQYGAFSSQAFTPGKIFKANNGVLFFDELNRCPEKLQNALLQVLEERKATIGSYDVDIRASFVFIATMNPDDATTERMSDVLLDRFDVIRMGYPEDTDTECKIIRRYGKELDTNVPDRLLSFLVLFVRKLRGSDKVEKKPGVRATIGLYERAQSNAILRGKNEVDWKDVHDAVGSVLAHRLTLKPSVQYLQSPDSFVEEEWQKFTSTSRVGMERETDDTGDGP